jgi:hypothetical protein
MYCEDRIDVNTHNRRFFWKVVVDCLVLSSLGEDWVLVQVPETKKLVFLALFTSVRSTRYEKRISQCWSIILKIKSEALALGFGLPPNSIFHDD